MTLVEKIDNIQKAIFDYEIANVAGNIVSVFQETIDTQTIDVKNPQVLNQFNQLMGECMSALQNKDYLLLADLLEYRMKPMLK